MLLKVSMDIKDANIQNIKFTLYSLSLGVNFEQ